MFDWRISIHRPPGMVGVQIYVWRRHPQGDTEYLVGGGKVSKTVKDAIAQSNLNQLVFATLQSDELADLLLAALQDSGFTLPKADYTAGKLEATEKHLEDTRTLLSLNVPNLVNPIPTQEMQGKK